MAAPQDLHQQFQQQQQPGLAGVTTRHTVDVPVQHPQAAQQDLQQPQLQQQQCRQASPTQQCSLLHQQAATSSAEMKAYPVLQPSGSGAGSQQCNGASGSGSSSNASSSRAPAAPAATAGGADSGAAAAVANIQQLLVHPNGNQEGVLPAAVGDATCPAAAVVQPHSARRLSRRPPRLVGQCPITDLDPGPCLGLAPRPSPSPECNLCYTKTETLVRTSLYTGCFGAFSATRCSQCTHWAMQGLFCLCCPSRAGSTMCSAGSTMCSVFYSGWLAAPDLAASVASLGAALVEEQSSWTSWWATEPTRRLTHTAVGSVATSI